LLLTADFRSGNVAAMNNPNSPSYSIVSSDTKTSRTLLKEEATGKTRLVVMHLEPSGTWWFRRKDMCGSEFISRKDGGENEAARRAWSQALTAEELKAAQATDES